MADVLTAAAAIGCVHAPDANAIVVPSQSKLLIDGQPAYTASDLQAATIAPGTCPNQNPGAGQKPCTKVAALTAGQATQLQVDGQAVMLATAAAMMDSTPPGTLSVKRSGQTKLTAS